MYICLLSADVPSVCMDVETNTHSHTGTIHDQHLQASADEFKIGAKFFAFPAKGTHLRLSATISLGRFRDNRKNDFAHTQRQRQRQRHSDECRHGQPPFRPQVSVLFRSGVKIQIHR